MLTSCANDACRTWIGGPVAFYDHDGNEVCEKCHKNLEPVEDYNRRKKFAEFQEIVDSVTYKPGWYLRTGVEDTRMWVQVGVTDEAEISYDVVEKRRVPWRGAKHFLSEHMCRNEIVSTVYHAIERAELHEVKEWFRYRGASIFNPHLDPDALVETARFKKNFDMRKNAMTMD